MYGTVARFSVKPGHMDDLVGIFEEEDRGRQIPGSVSINCYKLDSDPNILMLAVVFTDKASYVANADEPEQDKWYQRVREHLTADPDWHDGEVVFSMTK